MYICPIICLAKLVKLFIGFTICMLTKDNIGKIPHSVKQVVKESWESSKIFHHISLLWAISRVKILEKVHFLLNSQVMCQNQVQYPYLLINISHHSGYYLLSTDSLFSVPKSIQHKLQVAGISYYQLSNSNFSFCS